MNPRLRYLHSTEPFYPVMGESKALSNARAQAAIYLAQVEAVLAIHKPVYPFIQSRAGEAACSECRTISGGWVEYPCRTVIACTDRGTTDD